MILLARDIKGVINKLVKKYGTRNPFTLADELGIIVQFADIKSLCGFYTPLKRQRVILLNSQLRNDENEKYLNAVMAHELGHAILHRDSQCYFYSDRTFFLKSKPEVEANTFAAELLISDEDIFEHQSYTTAQLSRVTGYEERLVELRMKNYDIYSRKELI